MAIRGGLPAWDAGCRLYPSGQSLLDVYTQLSPGCIIADMVMPGMKKLGAHDLTELIAMAIRGGFYDIAPLPEPPPKIRARP